MYNIYYRFNNQEMCCLLLSFHYYSHQIQIKLKINIDILMYKKKNINWNNVTEFNTISHLRFLYKIFRLVGTYKTNTIVLYDIA